MKKPANNTQLNMAPNSTDLGFRTLAENVTVTNDTRLSGLNNNDLIIGGSGSGKTGGYIFQMLLNPYGSMVVSDTKGQLHKIFKDYLIQKGYDVQVLDFVNPQQSIAYNPLRYIGRNPDGSLCERDIKRLATTIVPTLDQDEPFWEKAATRYISVLIGYVLEAFEEKNQTMYSVVKVHRALKKDKSMQLLENWADRHPDSFSGGKYLEMAGSSSAEKMWNSIMEFANEGLDSFGYRDFLPIFSGKGSFHLSDLSKRKTVLFVNCSDNDPSFHVLSTIFNTQLLQTLISTADASEGGRLPVPVRLVLDDFSAAPRIDNFDGIISIIRSREISVSVIIQSMSQLYSRYNQEEGTTIINNCDHILYLSGHDQVTARFIADYLDRTHHTVLSLPREKSVLIADGQRAQIVTKLKPYAVDVASLLQADSEGEPSPSAPAAPNKDMALEGAMTPSSPAGSASPSATPSDPSAEEPDAILSSYNADMVASASKEPDIADEVEAKIRSLLNNSDAEWEWVDTRTPVDLYQQSILDEELMNWKIENGYIDFDDNDMYDTEEDFDDYFKDENDDET